MKFGLLVMGYDIPSGLKFKLRNVLPRMSKHALDY